ncbi:MFS transporter [Sphaerisporangium rufum]|uniref:Putative proline/betaine transporter n=1 Tax=Sphaerisporangium rufum TaxID=1381558 RepID=A0A919V2C1_9ACTN|nr:MFS transporter [Sphaerisporangium rufum]GII75150.1 MFS transporter [Sphaerisporangium rufum]
MSDSTRTHSRAPRSKANKVAFASLIGTTMEWYDFYLYGTAAALVFNKQFFSSLSPTSGTLASFATFAVGFLARPLGGIIFGHFGDRVGRKATLVVSLLVMGLASTMIGLLPTYADIGLWAPVLLVALRLLQGIGLGGETSGAVLMSVEHAPSARSNFFGGFPQMGVPAGLVLANLVYFAATSLSTAESFTTWVWRVPFVLSIVLVAIGLVIRLRLTESPSFSAVREKDELVDIPGWAALKGHWPKIIATVLMVTAASSCSYVFTVFSLSYGSANLGLDRQTLLLGVTIGSVLWLLSIPFWSRAADRYGRRRIFLFGSVVLLLAAAAYFPIFNIGTTLTAGVAFLCMALTTPISHALQGSIMADVFPAAMRYSGMGIILGLGSLIGGTAPLIATALFAGAGTTTPVTLYLVGICTTSLVAAIVLFRLAPGIDKGQHLGAPIPGPARDPQPTV